MKRLILTFAVVVSGLFAATVPAAASGAWYTQHSKVCRPASHWFEIPKRGSCVEPISPVRSWYR